MSNFQIGGDMLAPPPEPSLALEDAHSNNSAVIFHFGRTRINFFHAYTYDICI